MFRLIKQVIIELLTFIKSLANKSILLNNEPCMIKPFIINKNPVELKYYPFMISLDNCNESCNSVNNLPMRICFG